MKLDKSGSIIRALALLLVANLLATCNGDRSSNTEDDRGVFGEMADALHSAEAGFLTANAEIFASAKYMQPFIAALLELNPNNVSAEKAELSCLPPGVGGRTYTLNGTPFTSVADTLVPDHTARFRLFRLSTAGQPLLNHELGYIDYSCSDVESTLTELRVVSDTSTVSSLTYSVANDRLSGEFGEAKGSETLTFGSLHDDVGELRLKFLFEAGPCGFHYPISGGETRSGGAQITQFVPRLDHLDIRELQMQFEANEHDSIVAGACFYLDSTQLHLSACIESGTIAEPVFSPPSTHCYEGYDLISVNDAQLQAMSDCYQSLHAFWLNVANSSEICRSLVPSIR